MKKCILVLLMLLINITSNAIELHSDTVFVSNTYIVNFEKNSFIPEEEDLLLLKGITKPVIVSAFASPEGNFDYNQWLSEKRAEAIQEYLESIGVEVIVAKGMGVWRKSSNRIAIIQLL